ncbi:DUF4091 domain-containing protein [Paenibacillus thermotolerans]|uniref:DUF4091 domain-containing protein n=1 Tax=Paenibacillus thermotolerans TaxID=3027807 RepID=UPI0023676ED9|nr:MULTISPECIES: DUF4091 domain-containing protein [unclassified Paenibacillus]
MKYQVFGANEWLYPDSVVEEGGRRSIELASARGSYAACQVLLNEVPAGIPIECKFVGGGLPEPELYQLTDIFVEQNTGPVSHLVKEGESAEAYATRKAPFRVYDALKPFAEGVVTRAETDALYVCWRIEERLVPGTYGGTLTMKVGEQECVIPVTVEVFSAVVPAQGTLSIVNWFLLDRMATRYGLELWSEEHWANIRKYGELMRRGRQTHFWVPPNVTVDVTETSEGVYGFTFDRAKRLIRLFFDLGFTHIEGGLIAGRNDFWDSTFVIWLKDKTLKAISAEGYAYIAQYLKAWRAFLEKNGWLDRLVQHVADEPTENSVQEYRILSGMVRKFMPGIPIIEAVETYDIAGAVDILVPKNSYYQDQRDEFEKLRSIGDRLWFYTCCFPGGHYMNRLWDMPLLRTRYLHWGNYKYDLEGYLHWGFNWCDEDKDPFNQTELFFPPGDTHISYPGPNGPWGSMRLEAMRAGIEDYELLKQLAAKDRPLADEIAASCFVSFNEANQDPEHFAAAHRRLLHAVSELAEA